MILKPFPVVVSVQVMPEQTAVLESAFSGEQEEHAEVQSCACLLVAGTNFAAVLAAYGQISIR